MNDDGLCFSSTDEALQHLANLTGQKVLVSGKKPEVEGTRNKPSNEAQQKNWDKHKLWGDPQHHKYPLFDEKTGKPDLDRSLAALRYLNMPRSKESYATETGGCDWKKLSQVLNNILKMILELDPESGVTYQPEDKMYSLLPESTKRRLNGYSPQD